MRQCETLALSHVSPSSTGEKKPRIGAGLFHCAALSYGMTILLTYLATCYAFAIILCARTTDMRKYRTWIAFLLLAPITFPYMLATVELGTRP